MFDGNWDAEAFFKRLTEANILSKNLGFRFCSVSGLQGLEEAVESMKNTANFVCVDDSSEGFADMENTPRKGIVKTVFIAMRHKVNNMQQRKQRLSVISELFRQFMSVLMQEKTRIAENFIYLDPRISVQEVDRYFLSGCVCVFYNIRIDSYMSLEYNPNEWIDGFSA